MLDQTIINKINDLLDKDLFSLSTHAELDVLKQGYNWSKEFIKKCLREGKKYSGKELYPDEGTRHDRFYCIHKYSLISSKLILIWFEVMEEIVIIHIQPLNRGSKEGRMGV